MSSATVMYVLKEYCLHRSPVPEKYGLLGALGPGFSSELLLLRWTKRE